MVIVYEAANTFEANLLKGLLEQQGIEVTIAGEYLQGGIGELPVAGLVTLSVEEIDLLAAQKIIKDYEAGVYALEDED
ncbi:MAG: DUF2007 domain-containing protein [Gammaproteobacteria bacterium]|nr:DUF2007 domain-containing protein [Gammaproteobacteria bacterium]